jgi:transposase
VDTLGLLLAVVVTAANVSDGRAAPRLLDQLDKGPYPRLKEVFGDARYNDNQFEERLEKRNVELEVKVTGRPPGATTFKVIKWRWVVERTFAWLSCDRRLSKDYEKRVWSSEARVRISAIGTMLRRLTRQPKKQAAQGVYVTHESA